MNDEQLISHLRVVPDYPVKGIIFFDVTTLFKDPECFREIVDRMVELYKGKLQKISSFSSFFAFRL